MNKSSAIFERFVQVIPDDRRGVGLGLYISTKLWRVGAVSGDATGSTATDGVAHTLGRIEREYRDAGGGRRASQREKNP